MLTPKPPEPYRNPRLLSEVYEWDHKLRRNSCVEVFVANALWACEHPEQMLPSLFAWFDIHYYRYEPYSWLWNGWFGRRRKLVEQRREVVWHRYTSADATVAEMSDLISRLWREEIDFDSALMERQL